MDRERIELKLSELLRENGFEIQSDSLEAESSLLDMDSLQYISFIADVEQAFDIAIPDEFLVKSDELHISDFAEMIENSLKLCS